MYTPILIQALQKSSIGKSFPMTMCFVTSRAEIRNGASRDRGYISPQTSKNTQIFYNVGYGVGKVCVLSIDWYTAHDKPMSSKFVKVHRARAFILLLIQVRKFDPRYAHYFIRKGMLTRGGKWDRIAYLATEMDVLLDVGQNGPFKILQKLKPKKFSGGYVVFYQQQKHRKSPVP
jgi:hypothetical protein